MEIYRDIEIVDLALKYKDILILGDLQLGYEEVLHKQGVMVPTFQIEDILKKLDNIFSRVEVNKVVINGDVKHEFGSISDQEWRDVLRLLDYLLEKVEEVILVKGNHDLVLGPIAKKRNIKVVDYYQIDDITILHGHKITPNLSKVIIMSHEHPTISFEERRGDNFKCFLLGEWKGSKLIVMPSFNPLIEGSDVTREKFLSPFLKEGVEDFEVFVVEEGKEFNFGKVKNVK